LVDRNPDAAPDQLAQQLLAFIFNVWQRVGIGGAIILDNGSSVPVTDLIEAAVFVWEKGTLAEQNDMQEFLKDFNESDAVPIISGVPCQPEYLTEVPTS
jgi:hypothetical protein